MHVVSSPNAAVPIAVTTGWLSALHGVVRRRYSDWAVRRRETAAARALFSATDIELQDMGINRGDVSAIVRGDYRRD
jgi:uncharacterized protein YjiS (DUF1127 family)